MKHQARKHQKRGGTIEASGKEAPEKRGYLCSTRQGSIGRKEIPLQHQARKHQKRGDTTEAPGKESPARGGTTASFPTLVFVSSPLA